MQLMSTTNEIYTLLDKIGEESIFYYFYRQQVFNNYHESRSQLTHKNDT